MKDIRRIPFSPPDITEAEIKLVSEALRSGWITTGPKVQELERKIADFVHTPKSVCMGSATACMEMILRALGVGEGDEVITCAYTYTATASCAVHVGAKVVFVDTRKTVWRWTMTNLLMPLLSAQRSLFLLILVVSCVTMTASTV